MATVRNVTRGTVVADRAEVARTPWAQFCGLMGRPALAPGEGMVFPGTRGVHTHFMRFPIDVVFCDGAGVVVGVSRALRPWRFSPYRLRARSVVELPAGAAADTAPGDVLAVQ